MPLKCFIVMDNATAHNQDLDDDLPDGSHFIKAKYLPPNTSPLVKLIYESILPKGL